MNIEDYRAYCLSIKGATECMPFDEFTLVYKVMNKMISYAPLNPKEGRFWANVKCDPDKSAKLMERSALILIKNIGLLFCWKVMFRMN